MLARQTLWKGIWFLSFGKVIFSSDASGKSSRHVTCPIGSGGYTASNVQYTRNAITADLKLAGPACDVYGDDLKYLRLLVDYETESRVHLKIYDTDEQVYQIPESVIPRPNGSVPAAHSSLEVFVVENPFSFAVQRKDNKETIFNTSGSNIVFASQYLRLRTSLPSRPVLYGLGEHTDPMMLKTLDYTRTLWSRDAGGVPQGTNLYGNHPVYFEHRVESNFTHGVVLLNSNGMDIKINKTEASGQYLEYNTVGGIIDLYFMAGPGPIDVAKQYSEVAGKPAMMPYWGFGFHQCRFPYGSIYAVAEVVRNYAAANIPLETMWTDIDYMDDFKVFTLRPVWFPLEKVRELVSYLHEHDQHYVMMVDPAVAYQDYETFNKGKEDEVFIRNSDGSIYRGIVWPGATAFPDWFNSNTQKFWSGQFKSFFDEKNGVDIDGLWIDMNEPANFCDWPCEVPEGFITSGWIETTPPMNVSERQQPLPLPKFPAGSQSPISRLSPRHDPGSKKGLAGRDLINPKYNIRNAGGSLSNHTLNTDLIHSNGLAEYDTHNMYGAMMSATSREAMLSRRPTKRPLVVTRSTFIGVGTKAAHWLGDNWSSWDAYRTSIRHMLQFTSFFQVPMVGADVCGFAGDTTETLCARWATLGAFYTFYRNHNSAPTVGQEFYRWPLVAEAARNAINIRYRLLDYLYTAFHKQTVDGTPVLSPMWFHYHSDPTTYPIDLQYFFGPSVLVSPVTKDESTTVTIYIPSGLFYDFHTLLPIHSTGSHYTLTSIPYTSIPLHIRGGAILPLRTSGANTTTSLRKIDFDVIVAPDGDGVAKGELYLDDGESLVQDAVSEIEFWWDGRELVMNGTFGYDAGEVKIQDAVILGDGPPKRVRLEKSLREGFAVDVEAISRYQYVYSEL